MAGLLDPSLIHPVYLVDFQHPVCIERAIDGLQFMKRGELGRDQGGNDAGGVCVGDHLNPPPPGLLCDS